MRTVLKAEKRRLATRGPLRVFCLTLVCMHFITLSLRLEALWRQGHFTLLQAQSWVVQPVLLLEWREAMKRVVLLGVLLGLLWVVLVVPLWAAASGIFVMLQRQLRRLGNHDRCQ